MSELDSPLLFVISFFCLEMTGNAHLALGTVPTTTSQNAPKCGFILAAYISKKKIYQNKILQAFLI